jgi:hypothetical protein
MIGLGLILKEAIVSESLKEFGAKKLFTEINKQLSPQELLKKCEELGISGDVTEKARLAKSTVDTLRSKLEECYPEYNEAQINKIKGNISEELMDKYFKNSCWEKIDGEVKGHGIDGLYVRRDKDGNIRDVLFCESKYNTSSLGRTVDGSKQMSKDWIKTKLDNLEIANPGNNDYSQIKGLVNNDNYRARLWQMNEVDNKLQISLKKIDSVGNEVSIDSLSGKENYKVNKIGDIDLNNPQSPYETKLTDLYNKIVENKIRT